MAWKRYLARAIFPAVLAAIGYAIHLLLPPAPRWILPGEFLGITSDSSHFWTIHRNYEYDHGNRISFQLRKMSDGALVADFLKSEPYLLSYAMSPSGRFVVGHDTHANCLHLIDRKDTSQRLIALDGVFEKIVEQDQKRRMRRALPYSWLPADEKYCVFAPSTGPLSQVCIIETSDGKIRKQFGVSERIHSVSADGVHAVITNQKAGAGESVLWDLTHNRDLTSRLGEFKKFIEFVPSTGQLLGYNASDSSEAVIWNLDDWKSQVLRGLRDAKFAPNGRWLIDQEAIAFDEPNDGRFPILRQSRITVLEVPSGNRRGSVVVNGMPSNFVFSTDDSQALITSHSPLGSCVVSMVQWPDCAVLWTREEDASVATSKVQFSSDGAIVVCSNERLEIWNGRTGKSITTLSPPQGPMGKQWAIRPWMNEGGQVVVAGAQRGIRPGSWEEWMKDRFPRLFPPANLFVLDANTGRAVLNAPLFSEDAQAWPSADGRMLLVRDWNGDAHEIRAYDIPSRPRWGWVIGVPIGLGGLTLAWRRWRQRKKPATMKMAVSGDPPCPS